jgi:hypothetical protein
MILGKGFRTQNGIPVRFRRENSNPNGLLLKGVVTATYVIDSEEHPKSEDTTNPPSAIYCDVLVYSSMSYCRWFPLTKVLVSQKRGGMHNDDIWKPRAISKNIFGDFNSTTGINPGSLDGDHVLIGFLNNSFNEPIVLRGIPHPSRDIYNEENELGKRIKLKVVDGDPDLVKHHGVFHGTLDSGDYVVNTVYANNGTTDENGKEPDPSIDGSSGNQKYSLPKDSVYSIEFKDISDSTNPVNTVVLTLKAIDNNIEVIKDGINIVTINDAGLSSILKLGSGLVSVAIADHLKILYNNLYTAIFSHIHPIGSPNTGLPVFTPTLPMWDQAIESDRLTIPDN